MTIKEKILEILKNKGITEYKFYKDTGVSRGTLSNNSGINEETIVKFFAYFPTIDANYIFKEVLPEENKEYDKPIDKAVVLKEPNTENYISKIDMLINSKNEVIEILKREVEDLRTDKIIFKNIIEKKILEIH